VAYHEASYAEAKAMRPLGRCVRNANRTKFAVGKATPGPEYMVMSSRGRPHPATSAVDVAMRPRTSVLAPVSGTVVGVKKYYLYGRYLDYRIAIRPTGVNGLRVVLIHVDRVRVRQGSTVTAGVTVLAVPRVFPFHSQVNTYVKSDVPHVHLEVKAVGH
jgi:murein DD-endopeptidase MepM/ murein hydrolase activator NlpD